MIFSLSVNLGELYFCSSGAANANLATQHKAVEQVVGTAFIYISKI